MTKEIFETIEYHIENNMLINIERDGIDENPLAGFPLYVNENILIMTRIHDFFNDGIVVLNTDDISDAYSLESDGFYEKMCRGEGFDRIKNPFVSCKDIPDILRQIDTDTKFVIVECEMSETETCFSIGKLIEVTEQFIKMKAFDRDGKWEEELREIPITEITMITIDDNYSKTYFKYMK